MHTGETDTETMKVKPNQKDKSLVAKLHRPPSIQSITHVYYFHYKEEKTDRDHFLKGWKAASGLLRTSITLKYT